MRLLFGYLYFIKLTDFNFAAGHLSRNNFAVMRDTAAAIIIQKYFRSCFFRHSYMQLHSASILIQSSIRCFSTRQKFLYRKQGKAATVIQVPAYCWVLFLLF